MAIVCHCRVLQINENPEQCDCTRIFRALQELNPDIDLTTNEAKSCWYKNLRQGNPKCKLCTRCWPNIQAHLQTLEPPEEQN